MHIIHIAAELTPIAKVGGLADVVLGLCRELSWKGNHVEIILPKYDGLNLNEVEAFEVYIHDLWSYFRGDWYHNTIWRGRVQGLTVYFIEPHDPQHYFNREKVYGYIDDIDRFSYFCRAALEFILKSGKEPQILHLHDWPTALIAPLYYDLYQPILKGVKIVLTIHNLEHQGKCSPHNLDDVGLSGSEYHYPDKMRDDSSEENLNLLKGGIVYSDFVTTVSPNYSQEAFTPFGGQGLEKTLKKHKEKFCGILNGVDYSYWNPEIDSFLPYHYSLKDLSKEKKTHPLIVKKGQLQSYLRHNLSLSEEKKPIISCVTRLVSQKGPELIKQALYKTLERGGQCILLGSSADEKTQSEFLDLKNEFADNRNIHIELSFHEQLSHLVYAGSDIMIVPSIFEPCGLTQMIAMKYGTIPLVRATGGLADSVWDIDDTRQPSEKRNGFSFIDPAKESLFGALDRAITYWFKHPVKWAKLMENGMEMDFSWNNPSNEYLKIYQSLIRLPA